MNIPIAQRMSRIGTETAFAVSLEAGTAIPPPHLIVPVRRLRKPQKETGHAAR